MSEKKKTIAIIGAGPTGSILGAFLSKNIYDVVLVARNKRHQQLTKNGLKITGVADIEATPTHLCESISGLSDFDLTTIFICTKTYSLKEILPEIKKIIKPQTQIISFQNGLGPEEDIAKALPEHGVARGVLNLAGSIVDEDGTVNMGWFNAPNFIGDFNNFDAEQLKLLVENFNEAGLTTELLDKEALQKRSFMKTVLNASLNPLCAITSLTMSEAMAAGLRPVVCQNLNESLKVGKAMGYEFDNEIITDLHEYLKKGGDHYPSMWHDLNAKGATEISHINCKIVALAAKYDISVPLNLILTSMVVAKEINVGVRDSDSIPKEIFTLCAEKCGAKKDVCSKRKECYHYLAKHIEL